MTPSGLQLQPQLPSRSTPLRLEEESTRLDSLSLRKVPHIISFTDLFEFAGVGRRRPAAPSSCRSARGRLPGLRQ